MADKTLTGVNSTSDWVTAYYGDDGYDFKKVDKLKHIKHVGQFASVVYVISKNTKTAHTDLFDSNYTTIDTTYEKCA